MVTGHAVAFTGNPSRLSQKSGNRVTTAPMVGASRRFRVRLRPNRRAARTGNPTALQKANKAIVIATAGNAYCTRNAPSAGKLEAVPALLTTFENAYSNPR